MSVRKVWMRMPYLLIAILLSSRAIVTATLFLISSAALAATPEQIKASVQKGVAWLVAQQDPDGSWGQSQNSQVAKTGFAVVKLEDLAYELGKNPFQTDPAKPDYYVYSQNVIKGLNYIFANAKARTITPQPAGNPDTNGNQIGVYWGWLPAVHTYETGIAMMAIAASRAPDRLVTTGSQAGRSYKEVLQDAVDYFGFGQTDIGSADRGGWDYVEKDNESTRSDNSTSGYAVLGLRYAQSWGFKCTVPQFVKSELSIWIDAIQDDVNGDPNDGGSYYTATSPGWVNLLKTGNLLFEMAFVGDTATTPRVQAAIAYIQRHWDDPNWDPGWKGPALRNGPHYQAAYCLMKGFESLGIDTITVMRSGVPVVVDWFDDMSTAILGTQNADGSWPSDHYDWGDLKNGSLVYTLSTEWPLLTLERVVPPLEVAIDIRPGSFPNSISLVDKGVVPVAILTTNTAKGERLTFDAATVDPKTVRFGPAQAAPVQYVLEDVDKDGDTDMILHFKTQETGIKAGDTSAALTGKTLKGRAIAGADSVRTVPPGT